MNYFIFPNQENDFASNNNQKILHIPSNINHESQICDLYEHGLNFPSYFGKNWDALLDCLRDLSFVKEKNILITHKDIPFKNDEESKHIYIEILFDAVTRWLEFPEHKFYIYFPDTCRTEITRIIEASRYQ